MISVSSVGDIISISVLIKDLLLAIDAAKGAGLEYREVVRELCILDVALLEVEPLVRTHETTPETNAIYEIAQRSLEQSRSLVATFIARLKKYNDTLGGAENVSVFKHTARCMQWQVSRSDIDRFRADLMSQIVSLRLILACAQS
jgi:hypothetical protein